MTAFNFQARFAPLVESGAKRQTIRTSRRCKPGALVQLYTGMRTKACRKLVIPDPVCDLVDYIGLHPNHITFGNRDHHPADPDDVARADGFRDYDDMLAWCRATYSNPYITGFVHRWRPASPAGEGVTV